MNSNTKHTYDFICFSDLAYEFSDSDRQKTEQKIKRRLKYYKLGSFDEERVSYLRRLKNELRQELDKGTRSRFFLKSASRFADMKDYKLDAMLDSYLKKYNEVSKDDMQQILTFTIFLYHLR